MIGTRLAVSQTLVPVSGLDFCCRARLDRDGADAWRDLRPVTLDIQSSPEARTAHHHRDYVRVRDLGSRNGVRIKVR